MKKRITILLIAISIIFLLSVAGIILYISHYTNLKNSPPSEKPYLVTKAICNETNYCEDYEIICQNNEIISIKKIIDGTTSNIAQEHILALIKRDKSLFGLIQFSPEWIDPRIKEELSEVCKQ